MRGLNAPEIRFLAILLVLGGSVREVKGQDLTGQWTGTAADRSSERKQRLVLSIREGDSTFGGVLHWYSPETQTIRHIIVSGRFYGKDSVLTIREDSSAHRAMGGAYIDPSAAVASITPASVSKDGAGISDHGQGPGAAKGPPGGFYVLVYRRAAGRRDMLEGDWHTSDGGAVKTGDWTIRLEKKAPPFIPLPVAKAAHKKKDSAEVRQFQAMQSRESPVEARIPLQGTDTIRIALYDNGEIDGDSVSLYMNNELVARHVLLSVNAKVIMVPIDKSIPVNRLVLFAENLGRLPPNTALMEVTVHGTTYNLFLSTDYKKNASVEFLLQE